MKLKVPQIPEEGLHLEGEDAPEVLEFKELLFRFEKPVHYVLDILWIEDKAVLARGKLSTTVRAQCVRTLEWFDIPLSVEDFECQVEVTKGDEVDLTPHIREDILLLLPTNPVLPNAEPIKTAPPPKKVGNSKVWRKLDQLKLK